MARIWGSVFLSGLFILAFLLVVLTSRPAPSGPRDAFINIDTQLQGEGGMVKVAKTKLSLNEQRYLDNFPRQIGDRQGIDDVHTESIEAGLKADALIIRTYTNQRLSQPMFLVIVHSPKSTSFHTPLACYKWNKYSIAESIQDTVSVRDTALGKLIDKQSSVTKDTQQLDSIGDWLSQKLNIQSTPIEIPVNKLIVYKTYNDKIIERRLDFHLYMKDLEFVSHEFTMLEVSALIPAYGRYDDIEAELKDFMGEVLALTLEDFSENSEMVISIIASFGPKGYLVIAALFMILLAMIIYPLATRKIFIWGRYEKVAEQDSENVGKVLDLPEKGMDQVSETETTTRPLILPFNLEEKTGNNKILVAYYNTQWVVEKATNTSAVSCSTFRDFLNKVIPGLPVKTADQFSELTRIAEATTYSVSEVDEARVTRSCYLADEVIKELYTKAMEHQ